MGFPLSCFSIYAIYLLFHPTSITLDLLKIQMSHFITGIKELIGCSINDYHGSPRIYPPTRWHKHVSHKRTHMHSCVWAHTLVNYGWCMFNLVSECTFNLVSECTFNQVSECTLNLFPYIKMYLFHKCGSLFGFRSVRRSPEIAEEIDRNLNSTNGKCTPAKGQPLGDVNR